MAQKRCRGTIKSTTDITVKKAHFPKVIGDQGPRDADESSVAIAAYPSYLISCLSYR